MSFEIGLSFFSFFRWLCRTCIPHTRSPHSVPPSQNNRFGYCRSERVWSFVYGTSADDMPDVCDWTAKSIEINPMTDSAYDIMSTANEVWSVRNARGSIVPLPTFTMLCFDCTTDPGFCGGEGRGECIVSAVFSIEW